MTTLTIYKVHSPETKKVYIGASTSSFHRLSILITSRYRQYTNLLEIKTPTQEEKDKMKLYHHACFEVLKNGTISLMEEYECKPNENVNLTKSLLMAKHMATVDETTRIDPKRKFDSTINEDRIEARKKRKKETDRKYYQTHGKIYDRQHAKEYYQKNRASILAGQKVKQRCQICNIIHTKATAHKHHLSPKHLHFIETGQPYVPKTSLERTTKSRLKKREIPFKCDCGANIRSCSKLSHFKSHKHLNFMANQIVAEI
jgi:hypothetical protein